MSNIASISWKLIRVLINVTCEKFLNGVLKIVKTPMEKDLMFDVTEKEKTHKPF